MHAQRIQPRAGAARAATVSRHASPRTALRARSSSGAAGAPTAATAPPPQDVNTVSRLMNAAVEFSLQRRLKEHSLIQVEVRGEAP